MKNLKYISLLSAVLLISSATHLPAISTDKAIKKTLLIAAAAEATAWGLGIISFGIGLALGEDYIEPFSQPLQITYRLHSKVFKGPFLLGASVALAGGGLLWCANKFAKKSGLFN